MDRITRPTIAPTCSKSLMPSMVAPRTFEVPAIRTRDGRFVKGQRSARWKGGRRMNSTGYFLVYMPEHPRANHGYVLEHVLIAERALGRPVPVEHPIHHVNEDRADNRPANLVICQDNAYHKLLHRRAAALKACGNPDFVRCSICSKYDDPEAMNAYGPYRGRHAGKSYRHPACERAALQARRKSA